MSRYGRPKALRPRADWFDDDSPLSPLCPELSVDEHVAVNTGLIWADGEPIMREPNPMGFGRDGEW